MKQGGFSTNPTRSEQLLFLTDDQLRQGIELMYFAYRGFTADPDRILADRAYGRAHHRAIHFINRRPGLTVNELLDFLGVTKQSLNRVLRQLVDEASSRAESVSRTDAAATSRSPRPAPCSSRRCPRPSAAGCAPPSPPPAPRRCSASAPCSSR